MILRKYSSALPDLPARVGDFSVSMIDGGPSGCMLDKTRGRKQRGSRWTGGPTTTGRRWLNGVTVKVKCQIKSGMPFIWGFFINLYLWKEVAFGLIKQLVNQDSRINYTRHFISRLIFYFSILRHTFNRHVLSLRLQEFLQLNEYYQYHNRYIYM